jgi:hypothetical protein
MICRKILFIKKLQQSRGTLTQNVQQTLSTLTCLIHTNKPLYPRR